MLSRFLRSTYRYRELPAVIGGNINAFPDSPPTRLLLKQGLVDAALQVDPPIPPISCRVSSRLDPCTGSE